MQQSFKFLNYTNREITKLLASKGIGTRTFFWCMHEQPAYRNKGMFLGESYPNAEYLARKGFYIPSGMALTKRQMDYVVAEMKDVMKQI